MSSPTYWTEFSALLDLSNVRTSTFTSADGHVLHKIELGEVGRPQIILSNPVYSPFLLLHPFASELAGEFHVVSWETRGSPYLDDVGDVEVDLDKHAEDLKALIETLPDAPRHALGYCSGDAVVAKAAAYLGVRFDSLFCIGPWSTAWPVSDTRFNQSFPPMLDSIAERHLAGDDVASLLQTIQNGAEEGHRRIGSSELLKNITTVNLRTESRLCALAMRTRRFIASCDGQPQDGTARVARAAALRDSIPCSILHCLDDHVMDYKDSIQALSEHPTVRVVLYRDGGHLVPFVYPERTSWEVKAFVRSVDTDSAKARTFDARDARAARMV